MRNGNRRLLSARNFLLAVSLLYVSFGAVGLAAALAPSAILLVFCGMAAMFLLVFPLEIVPYAIQAGCVGQPRAAWGCNLDVEDTQHGQTVIVIACVISIIGGLAGTWASRTEDEDAGRAVWLVLLGGSFAVAFWNLKVGFLDTAGGTPFGAPGLSIFWSTGYAAAYYFRFIKDKLSPRVDADRRG